MKFWWLDDVRRVAKEKRAVEAIAADEAWFELERWGFHEGKLVAVGLIFAHGTRYPVRLLYPDQFPEVPAWVEPQDNVRWSIHQYGSGGALCLELRPDNWVATATGADVLRSAHNLLSLENPLGESASHNNVPSAHHIGEIQAYDWGANPILIGAGCRDRVKDGEAYDLKALRWTAADNIWPIMLHDRQDHNSPRHPPGADINTWRFEIPVYVSTNAEPPLITNCQGLIDACAFEPEVAEQIHGKGSVLILFTGGYEITAFHISNEGEPFRRRIFVLPDQTDMRSGRKPDAAMKRVAVVGAGSVGSKISECLVRSGVTCLTLVDGDVMLPANLERHSLDWRDVGFRKVYGLKRHLLHISPGADIRVVDQNLNWQRSARTHAWQVASIADCDVIVDATGDAPSSLFLGAVATANRCPLVSAEVYEGGIGALIASCVPDRDPPFAVARAAFLAWCEQQGVVPPESGSRPYEALTEDGSPLIADDAAVTMTAGHAARVVLDIVDNHPASSAAAWMLIGFREGWLFRGHGHTILISVGEPDDSITESQGFEAQDVEAQAFVLALAKEYLDAGSTGK